MGNFDVDYPISLESVVDASIVTAFDSKFDGKILSNSDMDTIRKIFEDNGKKL